MTDSEKVIDRHPTQPSTMTLEKWKDRKDQMEYFNDRTWPYHGMSLQAMKLRTSVLNTFWRDHMSDRNGRRSGRATVCEAAVCGGAKSHLFIR